MSGRSWEAGDIAGIVANPFYAIQIHPSYCRRHAHPMSEEQWIVSNERAVAEVGRKGWLVCLLAVLKVDHRDWDLGASLEIADPYPAVTVHSNLCLEHEPIIDEDLWVSAGVIGLEERERVWMSNLLSVLKGGYIGHEPLGYQRK